MPIGVTALVGLGISAISAGASFSQAAKQSKDQKEAEEAATRAFEEQDKLLSKDIYGALQVPLETYRNEFRESTAQQSQAIQALSEADQRSLAAGVGRIGMVANERDTQTREAMASDIFNLDMTKANAREAQRRQILSLQKEEALGAQQAAAASDLARAKSLQAGMASLGDIAVQADGAFTDLYGGSNEAKAARKGRREDRMTARQANKAGRVASNQLASDYIKTGITPESEMNTDSYIDPFSQDNSAGLGYA